jgi:hypothetical protein
MARFLGPEDTGLFSSFTIPLTYIMFLHLGTFDGLWRQLPYYIGKEMPEKVNELASAAGAWSILLSIVTSFGFMCCAFYSLIHHDLYGFSGWASQAICCWAVFYGGYLVSTYRTLNHFVTYAKIQVSQIILNFGMVFLLPFLKFYGLCARATFPSVFGLWLCQIKRPLKIRYRFDRKALTELMKIGIPFSFWGSLYTNIWIATESALILSLGGIVGLGLFTVAAAIREGINNLPMAVWQVVNPRIVTSYAKDGSVRNANARLVWLTAGLTGFMALIALLLSFLIDIYVPYLIPKYVAGIPLMKVCLWFPVIQAAYLPLNVIFATGKSWIYGRGVIVGLMAFPLTTYLLVPVMGGPLAVMIGSLTGRAARTCAAYFDLYLLARQESML